jgi:membrane protein implicated in regulation of membrane protease activity
VFLRPTALRHLNKQDPNEATNVDALVGAPAVTTSVINQAGGQVKLSGEIWSAHTLGEDIDVNEKVIVVAIDGASARVIKAEEK